MSGFVSLIVPKGEDIRKAINDFALRHGITHAYISGAVGSAYGFVFNAPDANSFPIKPVSTRVEGPAEILAFSGEIMPKEEMEESIRHIYKDDPYEMFIHVHAAVAVAGAQVSGGGMIEGNSFRSVRVFLLPLEQTESQGND